MRVNLESPEYLNAKQGKEQLSAQFVKATERSSLRAFGAVAPRPTLNVVGVGIGPEETAGQETGRLAVKVFVQHKFPLSQLSQADMLPDSMNGQPVDVVEAGRFVRFADPDPKTKIRPAQPGCSIGYADPTGQTVMAGTLGAIVTRGGVLYLLSNNHVLADQNQLPLGSAIFQPGLLDGGINPTDQIAALSQFETLQTGAPNSVDCAIAQVSDPTLVSNQILHIGAPAGTRAAAIGDSVQKFGRTTSYTQGSVTSIDTDVTVAYEIGNLTFTGQIIIVGSAGAFSDAGDSGSLIVGTDNVAVGLLFGGSTQYTIANHIDAVLTALNVQLA